MSHSSSTSNPNQSPSSWTKLTHIVLQLSRYCLFFPSPTTKRNSPAPATRQQREVWTKSPLQSTRFCSFYGSDEKQLNQKTEEAAEREKKKIKTDCLC
jgi:hypothetical protein